MYKPIPIPIEWSQSSTAGAVRLPWTLQWHATCPVQPFVKHMSVSETGACPPNRILASSNKENDEKPLDLGRGNLLLLLFKRNKSICFPKFVPEHRRIIQNPTFGGSCLWSPDQPRVGLGGRLPVVCLSTCSSEPVNAASRNKVR